MRPRRDRCALPADRLPALVAAHQQPTGAAGQIGHVGAPLIEEQLEAGTQPVPPLLERRDAGITGGDLERDGAGRKCFLHERNREQTTAFDPSATTWATDAQPPRNGPG